MLIDWFTVAAQAINFLILVWLMRRYLYRPILDAIDAREKLVATRLSDAEAKMIEAGKKLDGFQKESDEFQSQRKSMLSQATEDARKAGEQIVSDAKIAADAVGSQRAESLAGEYRNLSEDIKRGTCEQVLEISRKALADLASTTLEQSMVETLDRKMRELNDGERDDLKAGLGAGGIVLVTSGFELPEIQRAKVRSLLVDVLGIERDVQFDTSAKLVSGIELSAGGKMIGWSIADYVQSLDDKVGEILNAK